VKNVRGLPKRRNSTRAYWRTDSAPPPSGESWVSWIEAGRDEEKPVDPGASGMTRVASGYGGEGKHVWTEPGPEGES
jgi:hypothetical protein